MRTGGLACQMEAEALFTAALGLTSPWFVSSLDYDREARKLVIRLDWARGSRFPVAEEDDGGHGGLYPVHDSEERCWRHLDFFECRCELVARLPRVRMDDGRVVTASVPWARKGSGFTLLMEAILLQFCAHMPVSAAARMAGEHDTRLWTLLKHYVDKAHAESDWSDVEVVAIDETSTKKGHTYCTNVLGMGPDGPRLLFMTEGKDAGCVGSFASEMPAHGAGRGQIKQVAIDMSKAYIKGVAEHLPDAAVSFDPFHVMKLCGGACDEVRKEVARKEGGLPKGALWSLRGNPGRLTDAAAAQREELCRQYSEIGRALAMREFLQDAWRYVDADEARGHFEHFCSWAQRSRLKPFVKLARTIRKHMEGILGYYPDYLTSAMIEAVNANIQQARRRARGFRNFTYMKTICYWIAGRLQLDLPQLRPAPF